MALHIAWRRSNVVNAQLFQENYFLYEGEGASQEQLKIALPH